MITQNRKVLIAGGAEETGGMLHDLGTSLDDCGITCHWLPQPESTLANILQAKNETNEVLSCDGISDIYLSEFSAVITSSSWRFCAAENDISILAFQNNVPVVRIMNSQMSGNHCLDYLIGSWEKYRYPPFRITAVNEPQKKAMIERYPQIQDNIVVIGNIAHLHLEQYMQEDPNTLNCKIRQLYNLDEEFVISLFISVCNSQALTELLEKSGKIIEYLRHTQGNNIAVIPVIPVVHGDYNIVEDYKKMWQHHNIVIRDNVPVNDVMFISNIVVSSPFSEAGMRALHIGKPLLYILTPSMTQYLSNMYNHNILPELEHEAALCVSPDESKALYHTMQALFSETERKYRSQQIMNNNLLYPKNALQKCTKIIAELSAQLSVIR